MSINETTGGDGIDEVPNVNEETDEEIKKRRANLRKAVANDDWERAEAIFQNYPYSVRDKLSDEGDTALHVAVRAGKIDFAGRLASSQYMKEDYLKQENSEKNTAFYLAAMFGNTRLAELMFNKEKELAMIRNGDGDLPIQMAAMLGHEKMVKYLYQSTKNKLLNKDRIELLVQLIDNDLYDVALMMLQDENKKGINNTGGLATLRATPKKEEEEGETALHALARRPLSRSMTENKKMHRKALELIKLPWDWETIAKLDYDENMHPKALELVRLLWETIAPLDYDLITKLIAKPWSLIHVAAQNGNIDFLSVLIKTHPDLIFRVDENGYSIFHRAVEYRHESIFKLVYKTPSIKSVIAAGKGRKEENNILHLAAKLPPQNRLNIVSGAALQMQRELWWFKEVRELMPPSFAEAKNEKGETARTLFTESHKNLMKEGEEWMKKTADSCMIVATLVTTIVFAAAFTLPGGVKEDTWAQAPFIVLASIDAISLVSSICSILSFLAILTARYAEEDFLWSLPQRLILGLFTLFISIIGMLTVFCMNLFIIFYDQGTTGPSALAISLALIPIMLISQQTDLLYDVLSAVFFAVAKLMQLSNYNFRKGQSSSLPFEGKQSKEEELNGRKQFV